MEPFMEVPGRMSRLMVEVKVGSEEREPRRGDMVRSVIWGVSLIKGAVVVGAEGGRGTYYCPCHSDT